MTPPVLVLGATGQVGLFAITRLLSLDRTVVAVTRRVSGMHQTNQRALWHADLPSAMDWAQDGDQPCALLSCGPVSLAVEALSIDRDRTHPGFSRVVITGTTSIESKRTSADRRENTLIGQLESGLERIEEFCRAGSIPL
ncbi:MAG: hypothetical protein R3212_08175, partial [Xanthomonadales bacterium]|nr:hypothetical protein [Xanthomonadales bacterium]